MCDPGDHEHFVSFWLRIEINDGWVTTFGYGLQDSFHGTANVVPFGLVQLHMVTLLNWHPLHYAAYQVSIIHEISQANCR